jgi:hypothetical protein
MLRVERELPERGERVELRALACAVYAIPDGEDPTRAEVESVRRACKRLAALGRVRLDLLTTHVPLRDTEVMSRRAALWVRRR